MTTAHRIYGFDLLRGIAAFGIVGCHLMLFPRTTSAMWITVFCDFNVALFAVLSGYFTSCEGKSFVGYVTKRFYKLAVPYFFWTVVYLLMSIGAQYCMTGSAKASEYTVGRWLSLVFLGNSSCHLWFIAYLFYGQVLLSLINVAFRGKGARQVVVVVLCIVFVVLSALNLGSVSRYPLRLFAFLFLGYVLRNARMKISLKICLPLLVAASILYVLGWYRIPQTCMDLILVVPVFLLFNNLNIHQQFLPFSMFVSNTSMGVYLVHPLFAFVMGLAIRRCFSEPFGMLPVVLDWIICWLLALIMTIGMKRIKILRPLFG